MWYKLVVGLLGCLLLVGSSEVCAQPSGTVFSCPGPTALTTVGGQVGNGDADHWVDVSRRLHALVFFLDIGTSGTISLLQSIDGGTTFETVDGSSFSSDETVIIDNPVGKFKANGATMVGNWNVTFHCGASAGGRP